MPLPIGHKALQRDALATRIITSSIVALMVVLAMTGWTFGFPGSWKGLRRPSTTPAACACGPTSSSASACCSLARRWPLGRPCGSSRHPGEAAGGRAVAAAFSCRRTKASGSSSSR